jgi:hypothetical protein
MGVDANNWKPQFVEREEQGIITALPQADGTIKYFQGNPDILGTIDTVRVYEKGRYKKGANVRVQLVDANGDDINHNGASFRVVMSSKGILMDVEMAMAGNGSGFTGDMDVKFVVDNPQDCIVPAQAKALVNTGEWIENMTGAEVDEQNALLRKQHTQGLRKQTHKTRGILLGVPDEKGKEEFSVTRETLGGLTPSS